MLYKCTNNKHWEEVFSINCSKKTRHLSKCNLNIYQSQHCMNLEIKCKICNFKTPKENKETLFLTFILAVIFICILYAHTLVHAHIHTHTQVIHTQLYTYKYQTMQGTNEKTQVKTVKLKSSSQQNKQQYYIKPRECEKIYLMISKIYREPILHNRKMLHNSLQ